MIRKIRNIFQPYMIRPMIYQCVTRYLTAMVVILLWNRFINGNQVYSVVRDGFFVVGLFFFALAWFQYLKMDGMTVHHLLEGRHKTKKRHSSKDIADFVDEKIIPFDELEEDEKTVCRFLNHIICGLLYLVPALVALFIL
ncbi:MAG: hypothetical protein LUF92_02810 [Clostridiales bacterium]|nr:hypothetical protein [Clostridiales bacterium]